MKKPLEANFLCLFAHRYATSLANKKNKRNIKSKRKISFLGSMCAITPRTFLP